MPAQSTTDMEHSLYTTSVLENCSNTVDTFISENDDSVEKYIRTAIDYMLQTVPPFLLAVGTFGNIMIILIFSRQQSSTSLNLFFKALAVADLTLLYAGLFPVWIKMVFNFDVLRTHIIVCKIVVMAYYIAGMLSAWFLVAMTAQRAASVIWPHRVNIFCAQRRATFYLVVITLFCCSVNSHILYGITLVSFANSTAGGWCGSWHTSSQGYNFFFNLIWPWIDMLMFSLCPSVMLVVSNSVLVWKVTDSVRKARVTLTSGQSHQLTSRTKKVSSMTVTLIVVSTTFFLLTSPLSLFFIVTPHTTPSADLDSTLRAIRSFMYQFLALMWYSNSAINFYLYCLTGTRFRRDVSQLLSGKTKQATTSSSNM